MCLSNTHQFIWSTGVNPQTKSNVPAEHIVSSVISKKKKKTRKTPKQVGCQRCCLRGTKKSNLQTATDTTALTDGLHSYRFKMTASSDNSLVELKSKWKPMKSLPNCKFNGTMQKGSTGLIKAKKWWAARKFWMTSDQTLLGCSSCKVANLTVSH